MELNHCQADVNCPHPLDCVLTAEIIAVGNQVREHESLQTLPDPLRQRIMVLYMSCRLFHDYMEKSGLDGWEGTLE